MKRWILLLLCVLLLAPGAMAQEEELPEGACLYVAHVDNSVLETLEASFVRSADGKEMSSLSVTMADPKEGSGVTLTLRGIPMGSVTVTFPFTSPIAEGRIVVDDAERSLFLNLQVADACAWGTLDYAYTGGMDDTIVMQGEWNVLFLNETEPGELPAEALAWMAETGTTLTHAAQE